MSIQQKITQDLKQAMLAKDEAKKSLLRVVIGEFNRVGKEVDDAKATAILKKMLENATDPANANPVEAEIIYSYLPSMLSEDQLKMLIAQIGDDEGVHSIKEMGKIMAVLKAEYGGRYDGKLASELIKARFK